MYSTLKDFFLNGDEPASENTAKLPENYLHSFDNLVTMVVMYHRQTKSIHHGVGMCMYAARNKRSNYRLRHKPHNLKGSELEVPQHHPVHYTLGYLELLNITTRDSGLKQYHISFDASTPRDAWPASEKRHGVVLGKDRKL